MDDKIFSYIQELLDYGVERKLYFWHDREFVRNQLLSILELEKWIAPPPASSREKRLDEILERILKWAGDNGRLEINSVTYRDLFDTKLMGAMMPRPSEVADVFAFLYGHSGPETATSYLYRLAQDSNYIRNDRIAKNDHWTVSTDYGELEVTVNLSKPEKDPQAIIKESKNQDTIYPECLLCKENEGYKGRADHPARQTLRTIPVRLKQEDWYLQYSPYIYYNEHAIVFSKDHRPMKISQNTFEYLLDFIRQFPHYFIGSNSDLPIVGGSILSHDHFQGGNYSFPMEQAELEYECTIPGFESIKAGIVKWPMSVIRLKGPNRKALSKLGGIILSSWEGYSDESVDIKAFTGQISHNTITPIARKKGKEFELDLVLRNNRQTERYPFGIFHPHEEVHHVKKENIGLIEVMGLAVLPGRLKEELETVSKWLQNGCAIENMTMDSAAGKHAEWAMGIMEKYPDIHSGNVQQIVKKEIGTVFLKALEHAGVFKRDLHGKKAFKRFIDFVKNRETISSL
ncbi:UDP-glucose--hexose-1-phosphate uridylyltransferase [Sporosarcina globispora]|uniref:UDP-glucose--hexose-1-phosphate uridylyltransferase n=1 Tax=Sporosarcina globispora TaxID=1459 RepID=UPI000B2E074C